jgi:hypothetical protein
MIVAKPVVNNEFWILQEGNRKIGNIQNTPNGYTIKVNDTVDQFKNIKAIAQEKQVEFAPTMKIFKPVAGTEAHGYPAGSKVHNAMWDVQRRLPLFTKTKKSKSWYAAGWYLIQQRREWEVVQSPKLITLTRYKYQGPFHSKEQANESVS